MRKIFPKFIAVFSLIIVVVFNGWAQTDNSPECVRARPKRILSRKIFPQTKFKLVKNKEFPFEYVGYETARLKNGDDLRIKNYGCENYSLDFRFETGRFKNNLNRTRFWYQTAARLMDSVSDNLIKDEFLPRVGTKALKAHIRKSKTLRFDDYVYFDDSEIKEGFNLAPVRKTKGGKYVVEISFGIGPL